jgi:hypothetical protein
MKKLLTKSNNMKKIKTFLFGQRVDPIDNCNCKGIHHTYNKESINRDQWFIEFRVGMLYDRRIIEMN